MEHNRASYDQWKRARAPQQHQCRCAGMEDSQLCMWLDAVELGHLWSVGLGVVATRARQQLLCCIECC